MDPIVQAEADRIVKQIFDTPTESEVFTDEAQLWKAARRLIAQALADAIAFQRAQDAAIARQEANAALAEGRWMNLGEIIAAAIAQDGRDGDMITVWR